MKVNLIEAHQYTDPMLSFEYELIIPFIPGQGNFSIEGGRVAGGDFEGAIARQYGAQTQAAGLMRVFSTTVQMPEKTIDEVLVNLAGGHELVYAGLMKTAHDVSVNIKERRDMVICKALNNWGEYCRAHLTQHGHYKSEYSVNTTVRIFDQKSKTVEQYKLYGFWPSNVPGIALDSTSSNAIEHAVTFKVDFVELEFQEESYEWFGSVLSEHENAPNG